MRQKTTTTTTTTTARTKTEHKNETHLRVVFGRRRPCLERWKSTMPKLGPIIHSWCLTCSRADQNDPLQGVQAAQGGIGEASSGGSGATRRERLVPGTPLRRNRRLLLLLFPHYLMATMQSVVTGQAPMTLEQKVTSGGKTNKKQEIIYTITETNRIKNRIPHTKNKKK